MRRSGHNFGHKGTVISVRLEDDICNNLEVEVYSRNPQFTEIVGCTYQYTMPHRNLKKGLNARYWVIGSEGFLAVSIRGEFN